MRSFTAVVGSLWVVVMFSACGGGSNDDNGNEAEGEGEGEAGDPCEGNEECGGELLCGGSQHDNRGRVCGHCTDTDECESGLCVNHLCGQCTITDAQAQIKACADPANTNEHGYCYEFADDCSNGTWQCPCCPSIGNLGCVYFVAFDTDIANVPVPEGNVQILLDDEALISISVSRAGVAVDVPTGKHSYTALKKGYPNYNGTVEVQANRSAFGYVVFDYSLQCSESCASLCDCVERHADCLTSCTSQCTCMQTCEDIGRGTSKYFGPGYCGEGNGEQQWDFDCAVLCGNQ